MGSGGRTGKTRKNGWKAAEQGKDGEPGVSVLVCASSRDQQKKETLEISVRFSFIIINEENH